MTGYVKLTEHNDCEGETWNFYIPIEGNESAILQVARAVLLQDADGDPEYEMEMTPIPEGEVDHVVKHAHGDGYMLDHNKLTGQLVLPENFDELVDNPDEDPLYKGGVADLMRETTDSSS